jgi:arginine-tRNA-protein transferase
MISVPLWLSSPHDCSYLDNKIAQSVVVYEGFVLDTLMYSRLIEQGFRRSGDQVYAPHCPSCQACVPSRIAVADFQADRKQKRCWQRNRDTQVTIKPAKFETEHFKLYKRYQAERHDRGDNQQISEQDYIEFLSSNWCNTWFVEFRINHQLAAVAIVDVLDNALSAVYTFFDPVFAQYSPGVFAVLWQIEHAKCLNLEYVYLGFWIKACRKMLYKNQYQPLQGLINQQWQTV